MNDNGPTSLDDDRYLADLRGKKTFVYEGGIKAICLIKYPAAFQGNRKLDNLSAHIDMLPTLMDLCNIPYSSDELDRISFAPILRGENQMPPERYLFWQSHAEMPQMERAFAVRKGDYKLVQQNKVNGSFDPEVHANYELFNIALDPYEKKNLVEESPEIKDELLAEYKKWFKDVTGDYGDLPYSILMDPAIQDPLVLTRRDWLGTRGIQDNETGYWMVDVVEDTDYTLEVSIRRTMEENCIIRVECDELSWDVPIRRNTRSNNISSISIPAGPHKITGKVILDGEHIGGVHYIKLTGLNY